MVKVDYNAETMMKMADIARLFECEESQICYAIKLCVLPRHYCVTNGNQHRVWNRQVIESLHRIRGGILPAEEKPEMANFLCMRLPGMQMRKKSVGPSIDKKYLIKVRTKSDWQPRK